MDLFSHQPKAETATLPATEHQTHAVFAELSLPFEEIWQGFTAYTHLWWPQQLRQESTSHIEKPGESQARFLSGRNVAGFRGTVDGLLAVPQVR